MKDKLIHNSKQLKDKDMPTRTVKEVKPTPIYNGVQVPTDGVIKIRKAKKSEVKGGVKLEESAKLKKGKSVFALVNGKLVEVTYNK